MRKFERMFLASTIRMCNELPATVFPLDYDMGSIKSYRSSFPPFTEVMFRAEISRYEDADFAELAAKHCDEHPDTRKQAISELRHLILERGICHPRRMDDAYLVKFLRSRRFIPALAHKLMYRYEQFCARYAYLYDCNPFSLGSVDGVFSGTVPDHPEHGRVVILKMGRWDTAKTSSLKLLRASLIMNELTSLQPRIQILGTTGIIDMEGCNFRQILQITPTVAYATLSISGLALPLNLHCIHVVNCNWALTPLAAIFKRMMPRIAWNRITFHGRDMESLHKYVDPACLPPEYGGSNQLLVEFEDWIQRIDRYKDDHMVQEMREMGYRV